MSDDLEMGEEFYGDKALRWYQVAATNLTISHLENGTKRVLIVQPTGSGKTLTIVSSLSHPKLRRALDVHTNRPLRVLFCAHKRRLLSQAESTFVDGCNVELITQSIFSDIPKEVLETGWDVTVLDESHHEACVSFQYQLDQIGERPIIGLTATPDRADGCIIKFEEIVEPISRVQAVAEGWLADSELRTFIDTPERDKTQIIKDIIDEFEKDFGQTMVFVRTKKEVSDLTSYMKSKKLKVASITSESDKQLDVILGQFEKKEIQFIINCNKISEGVDVKGCTDVILGRQFGSYPQINQVIGRTSRPDSESRVWELINPLSGTNLDTTVVIGTPKKHTLHYRINSTWTERTFDYTTVGSSIESAIRIGE